MFNGFLTAIISFFSAGIGKKVGDTVGFAAQVAVLTPVFLWLLANKEENAVTLTFSFTWGEITTLSSLAFFIVTVIRLTRPGSPDNRNTLH